MHRKLSPASGMLVLLAALIAGAGILVACERKPASAPPRVVAVAIREFKFEPATVTVHEGDTVNWKNDDFVPHTATEDVNKPGFDSGPIQTGAAWHYVARNKGTYNYICTLHPNMQGKLVVQ